MATVRGGQPMRIRLRMLRVSLTRITPRTQLAAIVGLAIVLALVPLLLTLLPASGAPTTKGTLAGASSATGSSGSTPAATAPQPTATATDVPTGSGPGGSGRSAATGCRFLSASAGKTAAVCGALCGAARSREPLGARHSTSTAVCHHGGAH